MEPPKYSWKGHVEPVEGSVPVKHLKAIKDLVKKKQGELVDAFESDEGWFFENYKGVDFNTEMNSSMIVVRGILADIEGTPYTFLTVIDGDGAPLDVIERPAKYVNRLNVVLSMFDVAHELSKIQKNASFRPRPMTFIEYLPVILCFVASALSFISMIPSSATSFWSMTGSDYWMSATGYLTPWGEWFAPGYTWYSLGSEWSIPGFVLLAGGVMLVIGGIVVKAGKSKVVIIVGALLPAVSAAIFACLMADDFSKYGRFVIPGFTTNFFRASGYSVYFDLYVSWGMSGGWYMSIVASAIGLIAASINVPKKST